MSHVVLIAGVSRHLGGRLAAQLSADPSVERIIGIDTQLPRTADLPALGRTEFVRADIRNPLVAKVMSQAGVTTVVHAALMASARGIGGRVPMQEMNVIGTMQLLAACQKSDTVRTVVLRSTAAVYGCGASAPAVFAEHTPPARGPRSGLSKDAIEVESYLRGFARRRPDVRTTVLRLAEVVGGATDSAFTRYLSRPVVPVPLGYDPRLQLVHESDAVEVLRRAATGEHPGTFNVAGDGVITLRQLVRRSGRLALPVLPPAVRAVGGLVRNTGIADFSSDDLRHLAYGRVMDTSALRHGFGYAPRHSSAEAADDLGHRPSARRRAPWPRVPLAPRGAS
ncbi:Rossmann-fold NAD(P)-binding domain-containing protein [Jatrophihabitans fulvus]